MTAKFAYKETMIVGLSESWQTLFFFCLAPIKLPFCTLSRVSPVLYSFKLSLDCVWVIAFPIVFSDSCSSPSSCACSPDSERDSANKMIVPGHLHIAVIKTSRGQARCMTPIQKVYLPKKKIKETEKKKIPKFTLASQVEELTCADCISFMFCVGRVVPCAVWGLSHHALGNDLPSEASVQISILRLHFMRCDLDKINSSRCLT